MKNRAKKIFLSSVAVSRLLGALGLASTVAFSSTASARMSAVPEMTKLGYRNIPLVTSDTIHKWVLGEAEPAKLIPGFCAGVALHFKNYKWDTDPCGKVAWQAEFKSNDGHPLIWASFGDGEETTLVLGGVHPDELTPIPVAFRFARHLAENPSLWSGQGVRVIVAPLVNPDGFLRKRAIRTNTNGVDLNRNFFTTDWYGRAKKWWQYFRLLVLRYFLVYFSYFDLE